jgi:hypothetical protein
MLLIGHCPPPPHPRGPRAFSPASSPTIATRLYRPFAIGRTFLSFLSNVTLSVPIFLMSAAVAGLRTSLGVVGNFEAKPAEKGTVGNWPFVCLDA